MLIETESVVNVTTTRLNSPSCYPAPPIQSKLTNKNFLYRNNLN